MATLQCQDLAIATRRPFWTTRMDSCDSASDCNGAECGRAGLALVETDAGKTFSTDDWVASLAYNILLTDARHRDTRCGFAPGSLNGHWSESFMGRVNQGVGTHVRYVTSAASVRDGVLQIKAEVQTSLAKLVDYGVATEVIVAAEYVGSGRVSVDIEILGTASDPSRIALTALRNENSWAWMF